MTEAASADAFDEHVWGYDARVGLPTTAGVAVARAIMDVTRLGPDDLDVELGAGTGDISVQRSQPPSRYVGLDRSHAMLHLSLAKAPEAAPGLVVAACDQLCPKAGRPSSFPRG